MMSIWNEIQAERQAQDAKHGGYTNDNRNSITDWITWIIQHLAFASRNTHAGTRQELIRVAALAVAAIEAYDRNNGFPR